MARLLPIYGLLAEFENPTDLLRAAEAVHESGYRRVDAYSPFPVEGLAEALRFRRTGLPIVVFVAGLVGGITGFVLQYYPSVIDYPVNVGGRPLNSWPAFIPVTFEMTILIAALVTVLAMLALNGLPMPYHPLFHVPRFARVTRDGFFLCIEAADPRFDREKTEAFLAGLKAKDVWEVPH